MDVSKISAGHNPPTDVNVIIEIPGGAGGGQPVKYEIDKDSGAVFVDRIVNAPMFYPNNYGFIPQTLHEDGDPIDVMVRTEVPFIPGSVVRCRPIGVLHMEDDGGPDDKIICLPLESVDPFQAEIQELDDLPMRHRQRIWHFFENYKSLDKGKWAKVGGWGDREMALKLINEAIARHLADKG
ncbi:MAG: inorganic diphosphatase [Pseudomonadota bacterium]